MIALFMLMLTFCKADIVNLVSLGGPVSVQIAISNALYENRLYVNIGNDSKQLFLGSNCDSGKFSYFDTQPGDSLVFTIDVVPRNITWSTLKNRNYDNMEHAVFAAIGHDNYTVGFEDLPDGEYEYEYASNMTILALEKAPDYNDMVFSVIGPVVRYTPSMPVLFVPRNSVVYAEDGKSTVVNYRVYAFDDFDGILKPVCSPSSGFAANIGQVWVTCVAANRFGLSTTRKFSVMIAPFESVGK